MLGGPQMNASFMNSPDSPMRKHQLTTQQFLPAQDRPYMNIHATESERPDNQPFESWTAKSSGPIKAGAAGAFSRNNQLIGVGLSGKERAPPPTLSQIIGMRQTQVSGELSKLADESNGRAARDAEQLAQGASGPVAAFI